MNRFEMSRLTVTRLTLAASLLVGVAATSGPALAQQPATGQFGQRVGNTYLPSTNDTNCVGLLCNPLPSVNASGAPARNQSEVAPPPPCQGLLCSLTPYGMQRPYTASEAAAVERQRAAAQAQAAAPAEPMASVRHARKHRKSAAVKAATRTAAPADPAQ